MQVCSTDLETFQRLFVNQFNLSISAISKNYSSPLSQTGNSAVSLGMSSEIGGTSTGALGILSIQNLYSFRL